MLGPMGYWFLFIAIALPVLAFSARPASSRWWRMGRSVLAFAIGYGVTMIWFYLDYKYFRTVHSRLGAHWFMMGWLWTLAYMGIWELAWRMKHRKALISIRRGMGDDFVNGKVLVLGYIGQLLFVLLFVVPTIVMEWNFHQQ